MLFGVRLLCVQEGVCVAVNTRNELSEITARPVRWVPPMLAGRLKIHLPEITKSVRWVSIKKLLLKTHDHDSECTDVRDRTGISTGVLFTRLASLAFWSWALNLARFWFTFGARD